MTSTTTNNNNQPNNNIAKSIFEPLSAGESVVFSLPQIEGTFRKRKTSEVQITTNRIAIIDYKHPENSYALPLEYVDDVIVFDQHRISDSGYQMYGTRSTFSYYAGKGTTKSKSIGSVYFISYKYTDIVVNDVNDPAGMCKLVTGLAKQRKAILEELKEGK